MPDPVAVIDAMIAETVAQPRTYAKGPTGGARQMPDGELLGKFIRFTVLSEARGRILGQQARTLEDIRKEFDQRVGEW